MADVAGDLKTWSATAGSNSPAGSTAIGSGLDDNLRAIQAVVRQDLATKGADIASATTTDLGAVAGFMHDITGTTTITGFGTVSAGIWKLIKFEGALTLTHNSTSLILPGGVNITTADGDTALVVSEGSGNWRVHHYTIAAPASQAYTGTLTGCTTAPTGSITYSQSGNIVSITVPPFTATSNATSKTITGMPASIRPASTKIFVGNISDNGGASVPSQVNLSSGGVLTYYANLDAGNWTSSGTASIQGQSFTYTVP